MDREQARELRRRLEETLTDGKDNPLGRALDLVIESRGGDQHPSPISTAHAAPDTNGSMAKHGKHKKKFHDG
jgi:hypothetical protein